MLEAVTESLSELLWQATCGFQEATMLLEHMGHHMEEMGASARAKKFLDKAHELQKQAFDFQKKAVEHQSLSSDNMQ